MTVLDRLIAINERALARTDITDYQRTLIKAELAQLRAKQGGAKC